MKYYILDHFGTVKNELNQEDFTFFAEELLFIFDQDNDFNKNKYTIGNFITFFNRKYTTGGKRYIESDADNFPINMRTKGSNVIKLQLNGDYIYSESKNGEYSIINPEHIFYNYKPKNHSRYVYWIGEFVYRPKNYYNSQSRRSRQNYGSDFFLKPGTGRQTAVIDETLKETYRECLDKGYRLLKANRRIHKDSWDDSPRTKRSSGWKESTKRRHQNKPTDI